MAEEEVVLIGFWASPFSRRVETALKLKGVPYKFIDEDLKNKSPLLLKYNPAYKKVPVILHNGKPICDSVVILEYIDETWEGPKIMPENPYERAMARFWAKFIDEKLFWALMMDCWKGDKQQKFREEAIESLKILDNELKGKKFFGGDTIGLVDFVANCIGYWLGTIEEVLGIEFLTKEKFPNLREWADEFVQVSIIKENLPPRDRLLDFMRNRFVPASAPK